jgi:hypothetical protein
MSISQGVMCLVGVVAREGLGVVVLGLGMGMVYLESPELRGTLYGHI